MMMEVVCWTSVPGAGTLVQHLVCAEMEVVCWTSVPAPGVCRLSGRKGRARNTSCQQS
jgi:hypothetical protein